MSFENRFQEADFIQLEILSILSTSNEKWDIIDIMIKKDISR